MNECTCIQDESREWANCPEHGPYWKEYFEARDNPSRRGY